MKRLAAAAAALIACATAASASAAVYSVTYAGTVGNSAGAFADDALGLFGPAGASLAGDAFTAVYTTDTAAGALTAGDTQYVGPSTATLTINGDSYTIAGGAYSDAGVFPSFFNPSVAVLHNDALLYTPNAGGVLSSDLSNNVQGSTSDPNFPTKLGTAFALTSSEISSSGVQLVLEEEYPGGGYLNTEQLALRPNAVFSAGVSAAPEPSTWALLIAGLGVVGLALRRRAAPKVLARA